MVYIELKEVKTSFFRREMVCISNAVTPLDLSFKYRRLEKLSVMQGEKTLLETDGGNYINYLSLNKNFKLLDRSLKSINLAFLTERVSFSWVIDKSPAGYHVMACFGSAQYKIFEIKGDGVEGARIEFHDADNFIFPFGLLAFYWVRIKGDQIMTG